MDAQKARKTANKINERKKKAVEEYDKAQKKKYLVRSRAVKKEARKDFPGILRKIYKLINKEANKGKTQIVSLDLPKEVGKKFSTWYDRDDYYKTIEEELVAALESDRYEVCIPQYAGIHTVGIGWGDYNSFSDYEPRNDDYYENPCRS